MPVLQVRQAGAAAKYAASVTQAQKDYATISRNLRDLSQAQNSANPLVQAFNRLGQDLQSGNLQEGFLPPFVAGASGTGSGASAASASSNLGVSA